MSEPRLQPVLQKLVFDDDRIELWDEHGLVAVMLPGDVATLTFKVGEDRSLGQVGPSAEEIADAAQRLTRLRDRIAGRQPAGQVACGCGGQHFCESEIRPLVYLLHSAVAQLHDLGAERHAAEAMLDRFPHAWRWSPSAS